MTTGAVIRMVLMGAVFLLWAAWMFRTLALLRRRAAEDGGPLFPGPGGFLRQARRWLTAPEDRQDRNTLGFLTFVLAAMIASQALL